MIKIFAFSIAICFLTVAAQAQEGKPEKLAKDIAQAMMDSLKLNNTQKDDIYAYNMQLHNSKVIARKSSPNRSVVSQELQRIEKRRDSLYRIVLKDKEYEEYKMKKKNLVKKH